MAQENYGNEWIDYRQTYLRIPVAETGIYKITATELALEDIPIDSIATAGIRLFVHGNEVPIQVAGETAGKLGSDGYILFSGKRNDGYADTVLYTSPGAMPHPFYNLYSDTTTYFLTWQNDVRGLRTTFPAPGTINDSAAFHREESMQLFTSHYLPGRFFPPESNYETGSLMTGYDEGEGWTGPQIPERTPFEIILRTNKLFKEISTDIDCEILLAGWSAGVHSFALWLGAAKNLKRKLADLQVTGRKTRIIRFQIPIADFDETGELLLTLLPTGAGGHVSLSYARVRYPQAGPRTAPAYLQSSRLRVVKFAEIDPKTEYLIITHPLMRVRTGNPVPDKPGTNGPDAAAEYAQYRASEAGGGYTTTVVYSHELYDQFNAGQPGPQGIRDAIRWLHDKGHLKYVLLAGRSVDPQTARKTGDAWQRDMVPNAGWPGSDVALATMKGSHVPIVPIGRVNASNARQLLDYLQKVKAMEAEPAAAVWRKRILHLSGGRSRDELTLFKSYVGDFEKKLEDTVLGVSTISKLTDVAVEPVNIATQINEGVGLVTLFGHSSLDVTDMDIGRADDPARNYQNHPRYPAVIVNGCAAGSIFYSTQTLSSNWIFAPQSGAILFLAHTFNGPSTALKRYTETFYEVLADTAFTSQPFGIIQQEAIRRNLSRMPDTLDSITVQQMTLHGDPAIRIFPSLHTDTVASGQTTNLPPFMQVSIDGNPLVNGAIVSERPCLQIRIFDENLPLTDNDTTMVAVWLKMFCTDCTDVLMPMRGATGRNIEGKFYEITLPLMLMPGRYLVTIQCRDKTGQSSPPYLIQLKVAEQDGPIALTVSPNPARQWVRFTVENRHLRATDLELRILNTLGTTVFRQTLHCFTGLNAYFWEPARHSPGIAAGVYYYTLRSAEAAGPAAFRLESIRGHLLYLP